jgi:hypothetical protein
MVARRYGMQWDGNVHDDEGVSRILPGLAWSGDWNRATPYFWLLDPIAGGFPRTAISDLHRLNRLPGNPFRAPRALKPCEERRVVLHR